MKSMTPSRRNDGGKAINFCSNGGSNRRDLMSTVKNIGLVVVLAAASLHAFAQSDKFPERPIKLIVSFAAGGPTDVVARILGETLGKKLGQPIIVENKAGAAGAIGAEAIAAAAPDGYTLGVVTISTHVVNPGCKKDLKYDPITSFTPIALVADMPNIFVVRSDFKASNFKEFREVLKTNSEKYSLGTAGDCSYGHVMLEHLNQELGTHITHVPYRGSANAVTDLVGGSLDFMADTYPVVGPHIESGKLKALAVAWPTRLPNLPNVPTFDELKLPAMSVTSWYGIVAPANLPKAKLALISEKLAESMREPELQARFAKASIAAVQNSNPEKFKTFLSGQFKRESAFIQSRGMAGR